MIQVNILTHKRPEWCLFLLKQIATDKHKKNVTVFHDRCDSDYSQVENFCDSQGWEYLKTKKNFGKWEFWMLNNLTYDYVKGKQFDYFLQLPDDVILVENFFSRIINLMENETDCINPLTLNIHAKKRATSKIEAGLVANGWADCCFMTTKKVIDNIRIDKPINSTVKDPSRGSGVGSSFSRQYGTTFIYNKIKQVEYSLLFHRGSHGLTVMHDGNKWHGRFNDDYDSRMKDIDLDYIEKIHPDKLITNIKDLVRGKSVAFVGMGSNIKGKGLGKEIDSHDVIFRTNMFPIEKSLHKDYGRRCDIIAIQAAYEEFIPDYHNNGVKVIIHYNRINEHRAGLIYREVKLQERISIAKEINSKIIEVMQYPTAGLIAYFLCKVNGCKSFKYYGITGYQDKRGNIQNHNGENNYIKEYTDFWGERRERLLAKSLIADNYHNFRAHNEYIRYLIKEKLVELDQYSYEYFGSNSGKG